MGTIKSFTISNLHQDKFINEMANFGWKLTLKSDTTYNPSKPPIGRFFTGNDKPLKELTFELDPNYNNAKYIGLTNQYLKAKDKQIGSLYPSNGGFVTAIVFGNILSSLSLVIMFIGLETDTQAAVTVGIIGLILFIPAIILGIYGIIHRTRAYSKTNTKASEEIQSIINKASIK